MESEAHPSQAPHFPISQLSHQWTQKNHADPQNSEKWNVDCFKSVIFEEICYASIDNY